MQHVIRFENLQIHIFFKVSWKKVITELEEIT